MTRDGENEELLRRLDAWREGDGNPGTLIRWSAAHLRGCIAQPAPPADSRLLWCPACATGQSEGHRLELAPPEPDAGTLAAALVTMTDAARDVLYVYGDDLQSRALNKLSDATDNAHVILASRPAPRPPEPHGWEECTAGQSCPQEECNPPPVVGSTWTWEPDKPHARVDLIVTAVEHNGEEWWVESAGSQGKHWNSLSRWQEAVAPRPPEPRGLSPAGFYAHRYSPDAMAMGDCKVCGHVYEDHAPRPPEPDRTADGQDVIDAINKAWWAGHDAAKAEPDRTAALTAALIEWATTVHVPAPGDYRTAQGEVWGIVQGHVAAAPADAPVADGTAEP